MDMDVEKLMAQIAKDDVEEVAIEKLDDSPRNHFWTAAALYPTDARVRIDHYFKAELTKALEQFPIVNFIDVSAGRSERIIKSKDIRQAAVEIVKIVKNDFPNAKIKFLGINIKRDYFFLIMGNDEVAVFIDYVVMDVSKIETVTAHFFARDPAKIEESQLLKTLQRISKKESLRTYVLKIPVKIFTSDGRGELYSIDHTVPMDIRYIALLPEMYPFLEDPYALIADYFRTDEPIIVFKGDPGTGKTFFMGYISTILLGVEAQTSHIRNIISMIDDKYKESYQYLLQILSESYATDSFREIDSMNLVTPDSISYIKDVIIDYGARIIALDDGGYALASRDLSESARTIETLLSISGGFFFRDLKIMITMNTSGKMDEAVLRAGRTHSINEFGRLTPEDVDKFVERYNKVFNASLNISFDNPVTLAELFAVVKGKTWHKVTRSKRVGFM